MHLDMVLRHGFAVTTQWGKGAVVFQRAVGCAGAAVNAPKGKPGRGWLLTIPLPSRGRQLQKMSFEWELAGLSPSLGAHCPP